MLSHFKRGIQRLESVVGTHTRTAGSCLNGYDYTTIPSTPDRSKIFKLKLLAIRSKRNGLIRIFKMMTGKAAPPLIWSPLVSILYTRTRDEQQWIRNFNIVKLQAICNHFSSVFETFETCHLVKSIE